MWLCVPFVHLARCWVLLSSFLEGKWVWLFCFAYGSGPLPAIDGTGTPRELRAGTLKKGSRRLVMWCVGRWMGGTPCRYCVMPRCGTQPWSFDIGFGNHLAHLFFPFFFFSLSFLVGVSSLISGLFWIISVCRQDHLFLLSKLRWWQGPGRIWEEGLVFGIFWMDGLGNGLGCSPGLDVECAFWSCGLVLGC